MLTFLRKIRRSLIGSSSFQKYILYAIGEIALIVIGILLALQISNWNEVKKQEELERKTLREIQNELSSTRGEIESDLDAHLSEIQDMERVFSHLLEKKPFENNLWMSFINATRDHQVYLKSSAFENLKSVGLNIVSNDTLRREITEIYQLTLTRLQDRGDYNPKYDIESAFDPYVNRYLDIDDGSFNNMKIPGIEKEIKLYNGRIQDYNSFINDRGLLRELQIQLLERSNKIRLHQRTVNQLNKVVKMINDELSES